MARDPKLDLLRSVPLFSELGSGELERVAQLADEVELPAGHVLMRQGEIGSEMYVLVHGAASVDRDGRQLATMSPGSFIGDISLLSEGTRTATVTLTEPSQLLVVGHREFHRLMDSMPSVQAGVLASVAQKLRRLEADRPH
ncbi:MAG TPA: cyclic nucleotide-binding domain-containing protein [Candidatus Limnocylindrales bacterium]|nr:cyclic nucleotide-binding domain-containing protein [Candidatus Limnocylindrales bacterium]HEX5451675.1 cyclic nucleotide-binding domain-containing protein [Candidatus Limnocylindrales bacterium]